MQVAVRKAAVATWRLNLQGDLGLSYLLITPALFYIFALVGVPFFLALYFSVSSVSLGEPGRFVGLSNFIALVQNQIFRQAFANTFIFTFASQIIGGPLGLCLAFILLQKMPAKRLIRFFLMLPWTIPIALSTLSWKFIFDPELSIVNWILVRVIGPDARVNWLGTEFLAMATVVAVNVWRGIPFGAIVILAGMTSVSPEIIEAATVDGANWLQRWNYVVFPMILPILFVGLLFQIVFTFTDLSVVYLLTQGGPLNSTHILPSLAFQIGIASGQLGQGSATAVFMLPALLVFVVFMLRFLRRRDI